MAAICAFETFERRLESTDCVEEPRRLTRADGGCDGNQGGDSRPAPYVAKIGAG